MDAADTQTCGPRYLSAKQTVDDRALNRGVMDRLRQEIQAIDRPLRVVEIGAGIGTMAARLCDWQVLRRADYRLVDVDPELLAAGRVWLRTWGEGRGHAVVTDGDALRIHGPDVDLRVSFQTAELGALLARPSGEPADLLVANAFLDLVEVPAVLPGLFDLIVAGGLYLFTINFDGETIFQPEHPDDPMLMQAYHRCMDERVRFGRPAGESKAGRHLFGHLRAAGASVLAAGASDWVVHPGQLTTPATPPTRPSSCTPSSTPSPGPWPNARRYGPIRWPPGLPCAASRSSAPSWCSSHTSWTSVAAVLSKNRPSAKLPGMRKFAALMLAAGVCACSPPEKDSAAPMGVSFARDIKPIFVASCNECHHPTSAIGYDFTNPFDPAKGIIDRANSWAAPANGSMYPKIVDPGNVATSSIIAKVERTDLDLHMDGSPMPYQIERLTDAEVEAVRTWIAGGATMDAYAASVAPIFGTQITLGRASGKCSFCHYPGAPNGLDILAPFDNVKGLVNRTSMRYGAKLVAPGDPDNSVLMKKLTGATAGGQMPMHYPRLAGAQVKLMKDWIAAGAQNN